MDPDGRQHLENHLVAWMAQVSQAGKEELAALETCLTSDERARADRFHFSEDRARFIFGRGLLRKCLGQHLGVSPGSIDIITTPRGRPILRNDDTIQFSVSHSGDWVAVVITALCKVGIDLEHIRPHFDPHDVLDRAFCAEDLAIFRTIPEHEIAPVFFRAWTAKEAYLKARGEGISERLRDVSVVIRREENLRLRSDSHDSSAVQAWCFHPLALPSDYAGCIACDNLQKRLVCFKAMPKGSEVILGTSTTVSPVK